MSNRNFGDMGRFSGVFSSTGPKTPQGKAIAARNSTSHGLFARDVVLPSLGEDPEGYNTLYYTLCEQLEPRNILEHHYIEAIAAASWRLRRLHRWQAQVYENETLTEDERLNKLDRILRHETALNRQIDKSVRLLGREVPALYEGRARKEALADLGQTDRSCRADLRLEQDVADRVYDSLQCNRLPSDFDRSRLDNIRPDAPAADTEVVTETENCQNEPENRQDEFENCQNELGAGDEKETSEITRQKEVDRQRDAAWEAAHPLKPSKKVGRLRLAGCKKRGSTLPLLSSVLLPLKKSGRTLSWQLIK